MIKLLTLFNEIGSGTGRPYPYKQTYAGLREPMGRGYEVYRFTYRADIPGTKFTLIFKVVAKISVYYEKESYLDIAFLTDSSRDEVEHQYAALDLGTGHIFSVMATLRDIIKDALEQLDSPVYNIRFQAVTVDKLGDFSAKKGEQREKLYSKFISSMLPGGKVHQEIDYTEHQFEKPIKPSDIK